MVNAIKRNLNYDCEQIFNIPESRDVTANGHDFVDILLVEDNIADVRLVKEIFRDFKINSKIHVVKDGIEALDYLYKQKDYAYAQKPDIILLDINLPKKDGIELLYEIKRDNSLKYIPTIVLTNSYPCDGLEKRCCHYVNCYIAKLFHLEQYMDVALFIQNFWLTASKLPKKVNIRPNFNFLPQLLKSAQF